MTVSPLRVAAVERPYLHLVGEKCRRAPAHGADQSANTMDEGRAVVKRTFTELNPHAGRRTEGAMLCRDLVAVEPCRPRRVEISHVETELRGVLHEQAAADQPGGAREKHHERERLQRKLTTGIRRGAGARRRPQ